MNASIFTSDLLTLSVSPFNLMLRSVAVYAVVLLLLRIAGRRQIGQIAPTELVAMLLVSNAVQNSMNAGDSSLIGGLISAATLIFVSHVISYATYKSKKISSLIEGDPIVLVIAGKVQLEGLRKVLLTPEQLRAQLMYQGVEDVTSLKLVIMDSEGKMIVTHDQMKPLIA